MFFVHIRIDLIHEYTTSVIWFHTNILRAIIYYKLNTRAPINKHNVNRYSRILIANTK